MTEIDLAILRLQIQGMLTRNLALNMHIALSVQAGKSLREAADTAIRSIELTEEQQLAWLKPHDLNAASLALRIDEYNETVASFKSYVDRLIDRTL